MIGQCVFPYPPPVGDDSLVTQWNNGAKKASHKDTRVLQALVYGMNEG